MFAKCLPLLPAAGLALLSGPSFANWGSPQQGLIGEAEPAIAVSAEATRLAGEFGAQPRVQKYNIDESSFYWNGFGGAEAPARGGNIGGISDGTSNTYRPKSGYVIKKGKPLSPPRTPRARTQR